jgi:hypothetical protein
MATEVLRRVLAAKLALFIGVLAVLLLLALVDPAYEPTETL